MMVELEAKVGAVRGQGCTRPEGDQRERATALARRLLVAGFIAEYGISQL